VIDKSPFFRAAGGGMLPSAVEDLMDSHGRHQDTAAQIEEMSVQLNKRAGSCDTNPKRKRGIPRLRFGLVSRDRAH
jgi:hypothetical protein